MSAWTMWCELEVWFAPVPVNLPLLLALTNRQVSSTGRPFGKEFGVIFRVTWIGSFWPLEESARLGVESNRSCVREPVLVATEGFELSTRPPNILF
jgi:hypothetical protein